MAALVVSLLISASEPGIRRDLSSITRHVTQSDGVSFAMAPTAFPLQIADVCAALPSLQGATSLCLKGDGGYLATTADGGSALVITAQDAPVTQVLMQTPCNSWGCNVTSQRLDGVDDYFSTAATTSPTGDFTACALFRTESSTATAQTILTKHTTSATEDPFRMSTDNSSVTFTVFSDVGTSTSVSVSGVTWGAWHLACATYDYVADGTSIFTPYLDGVAGTASTSAHGPPLVESSPWYVGARESVFLKGAVQGAFVTHTLLTAGQMTALAQDTGLHTATIVRGANGEAVSSTRTDPSGCEASDGTYTRLPLNRPCFMDSGLLNERAGTFYAKYSEQLDNAAWTKVLSGDGTNPTVTPDQALSPQSTLTADRVVISAAASPSTSILRASGYDTTSGTLGLIYHARFRVKGNGTSGTIYIGDYNSTDGTKCTETACAYTSTAWADCKHWFAADETTTGSKHAIFIGYKSGHGCSDKAVQDFDGFVWGAQSSTRVAGEYNVTEGSTSGRSIHALVATSTLASPSDFCVGARIWPNTTEWLYAPLAAGIVAVGSSGLANSVVVEIANATVLANAGKPYLLVRDNANASFNLMGTVAMTLAPHYLYACTASPGVWTLWVDGVQQATTAPTGTGTGIITGTPTVVQLSASSMGVPAFKTTDIRVLNRSHP